MTQEQATKKVNSLTKGLTLKEGTIDLCVKMFMNNSDKKVSKRVKQMIQRNMITKPLTSQEYEDLQLKSKLGQLPSSMR